MARKHFWRCHLSNASKPAIAAMEGQGFYNRNSSLQAAGIEQILPLWREATRSIAIGAETPTIVDYGSSQGRNSMSPMRVAIAELRSKIPVDRPIEVYHTDLPSNDFTSLFKALAEDPESYLVGAHGVYSAAIGRSYFEPVLPAGRVHLGWNSWTLHWMSRKPVDAPDQIYGPLSQSAEVRTAVEEQLAQDWRQFLEVRAAELRPAGKLLCLFLGKGKERIGWEWLAGELWQAILDLGRSGRFSEEEQLRMTLPTGARSIDDVEAPFAGRKTFCGLHLELAEIMQGPDPFWQSFENTGDAKKLGESWSDMMRAVCGPTLSEGIDVGRDRPALIDELFVHYAQRLAANPQRHEHYLAVAILTKTRG
jgi:hypothetical protein